MYFFMYKSGTYNHTKFNNVLEQTLNTLMSMITFRDATIYLCMLNHYHIILDGTDVCNHIDISCIVIY